MYMAYTIEPSFAQLKNCIHVLLLTMCSIDSGTVRILRRIAFAIPPMLEITGLAKTISSQLYNLDIDIFCLSIQGWNALTVSAGCLVAMHHSKRSADKIVNKILFNLTKFILITHFLQLFRDQALDIILLHVFYITLCNSLATISPQYACLDVFSYIRLKSVRVKHYVLDL
jgi:hypothetical protein